MSRLIPLAHRLWTGAMSRVRNLLYGAAGVELQGYVWMRAIEIPRNWSDVTLGAGVALDRGTVLLCSGPPKPGKLVIGSGTYVNRYCMFDAHERIEVGRDCMIGPYCYVTDGDHGTEPGCAVKSQPMSSSPVVIEDEAWLGARVTVLAGTRIGRGAVIGAGSVVTSDIPADAIAVGVPARVTRFRSSTH